MNEDLKLKKLTPIKDVNLDTYDKVYKNILADKDIKNVAISGPYGAGKSSLIETYENKAGKKFLHISLAHFQEKEEIFMGKSAQENGNQLSIESIIEGKILNQLIQQIDPERISKTGFRIKKTSNNNVKMKLTVGIIIFILSISYIWNFKTLIAFLDSFEKSFPSFYVGNQILKFLINPMMEIIIWLVIIFLLFLGIKILVELQDNKNVLRKLSFQGNEIEILSDNETSYFDKYLNEVLYIFENVEEDVIVFEDIDRYDNIVIFERLREINRLTNIRLQNIIDENGNYKVLRFFYLIRDDIFENKDRTKFFDLIIPVIPVIDGSNSFNKIKEYLEDVGLYHKFNDRFLRGVSLYIDDMRLLLNIYNEFLIYYNRLNGIEFDINKMFAMIVYKNLFPKDFNDLYLKQGFVYTLFEKKNWFVKNEKENILNEIEDLNERLSTSKNEIALNLNELNAIKEDKEQKARSHGYYSNRYKEYQEWLKNDYPKRQKAIEDRVESNQKALENKVFELKRKLDNIDNLKLSEIINRENENLIFSMTSKNELNEEITFESVKRNEYFPLLKYLIRESYIAEDYTDCISYFYPNSLTIQDKNFLKSINDRKAKPYGYVLDNIPLVLTNLCEYDFQQIETRNYYLFEYLLDNPQYEEYLRIFITQLKHENHFEFLSEYYTIDKYCNKHFEYTLFKYWIEFLKEILINFIIPAPILKTYTINLLTELNAEELDMINIDNCLHNYLVEAKFYLNIESPNIEKIIKAFEVLKVKFKYLNYEGSNVDLFNEVYKESMYTLNIDNIVEILRNVYKIDDLENKLDMLMSLITSDMNQPLFKYVDSKIDSTCSLLIEQGDYEINDNIDTFLYILNNSSVSRVVKEKYIEKSKTVLSDLRLINETTLWNNLLENDLASYKEENMVSYYLEYGMTKNLIRYINLNNRILDFTSIDIDENNRINLFCDVIKAYAINLNKYEEIVTSLNVNIEEFDISDIDANRIKILIDSNLIIMNEINLKFIRDNYRYEAVKFIINNWESYMSIIDNIISDKNEIEQLLKQDVNLDDKIKLLSSCDESFSIVDKSYNSQIEKYIIQNNLEERDIPYLLLHYSSYNDDVKKVIFELAKNHIVDILDETYILGEELIEHLILSDISRSFKLELFIKSLGKVDLTNWRLNLLKLGFIEINKIFEKNKRPNIINNQENTLILNALKEHGLIKDFVLVGDKYKVDKIKNK